MGAIDQERLLDALAAQVKEHLLQVFTWTDGGCAFEAREAPREAVTLKLSTGQMILEAVRLTRRPKAIRSGLGDLDRVVVLSTDPMLRFQRIALAAEDGFVLSRVDGISTARELLQLVPLPADDAERSLFGLLCTGLVDFLPREAAGPEPSAEERRAEILDAFASLARRSHFEVLEVPRDATQADITAAYHRVARRFHPDVHHEPGLGDVRAELDAIFERASVAYEVLRRPGSRREYVATLDRAGRARRPPPSPAIRLAPTPPADDEAARAEQAMAMAAERQKDGRQWEAIGLLEGLVTVATGALRRRARLQLAAIYANNPRSGKAAEEQLDEVLAENPGDVDAHLGLARLFQGRGMPGRSIDHLRQVLATQPRHRAALRMVAELDVSPKTFRRLRNR
jgi:curved DNA-binding protein CbpA